MIGRGVFLLLLLLSFVAAIDAQSSGPMVHKIDGEIELDGRLEEAFWQSMPKNKAFHQFFPSDSIFAEYGTELYFASDGDNFIIGIRCETPGEEYIVPSLRRDFRAGGNDNITILVDTYNDGNNAFMFGINPLGVIREGLIADGGNSLGGFSTAWDNKWQGESYIGENFWSSELVIPYSTLRFNDGVPSWKINSYRFDMQANERSVWYKIPRNQWIFNLAFSEDVRFEEPPRKKGKNISIIPYVTGALSQEDLSTSDQIDVSGNVGFDAKIGLTSGLNLDLSFNPDFSQVEVDQQITNLSRFEISFPERRQFFIENADLFGSFGESRINPFFSRRIGLAVDTVTELTVQNAILYGARLSGKLNDNLRVGLLNTQTANSPDKGIAGTNYSVATVQQKVFARSNVTAMVVNKLVTGDFDDTEINQSNTVAGLQFNFQSESNDWVGSAFVMKSFTDDLEGEDIAHTARLRYNSLHFTAEVIQNRVGENFNAEVGFVPRTDLQRFALELGGNIFPKSDVINQLEINAEGNIFIQPGENFRTDSRGGLSINSRFNNTANAELELRSEYVFLRSEFFPIGDDFPELPEGTDYNFSSAQLSYQSDRRKFFNYRLNSTYGSFYNGRRYGLGGNVQLRFEPKLIIGVRYNVDRIELAEGFGERTLVLVGPRVDYTVSKELFLTGFFQYNTQIDNFNVNARLQWRFAPVSDLFIVYTDNYDTADNWSGINRNLTVKLSYWFNI